MHNNNFIKMISCIKNGQKTKLKSVFFPHQPSLFCLSFLEILIKEGYILNYVYSLNKSNINGININLKYGKTGYAAIRNICQISKASRRVYIKNVSLWKIKNGAGIFLISTSKGLFTDMEARTLNVGGELICSVT